MGCNPSKSNVVHPLAKPAEPHNNGSLPTETVTTTAVAPNSTANENGGTLTTDQVTNNNTTIHENQPSPTSNDRHEQNNEELVTNEDGDTTNSLLPSHPVHDVLQQNQDYHVLWNEPPPVASALPSHLAARKAELRGPGTDSQVEFFKMLDRKIEAGPDYKES
ncbi:uncharacterized protein [Dysidea avara]|uniref:uncharacterized protein n=1 Tax=Dysidea avara TaxID=196820 RepID=UPI00332FACF7